MYRGDPPASPTPDPDGDSDDDRHRVANAFTVTLPPIKAKHPTRADGTDRAAHDEHPHVDHVGRSKKDLENATGLIKILEAALPAYFNRETSLADDAVQLETRFKATTKQLGSVHRVVSKQDEPTAKQLLQPLADQLRRAETIIQSLILHLQSGDTLFSSRSDAILATTMARNCVIRAWTALDIQYELLVADYDRTRGPTIKEITADRVARQVNPAMEARRKNEQALVTDRIATGLATTTTRSAIFATGRNASTNGSARSSRRPASPGPSGQYRVAFAGRNDNEAATSVHPIRYTDRPAPAAAAAARDSDTLRREAAPLRVADSANRSNIHPGSTATRGRGRGRSTSARPDGLAQ